MKELWSGVAAFMLLGFSSCSSPAAGHGGTADIVDRLFPEAQAAVQATRAACTEAALNRDWDALRSYHLASPKFSKITRKGLRFDFEQMIAGEIAGVSAMLDAMPDIKADLRDQKIDVFGDTAVETAFLVVTGTLPTGDQMDVEIGVSAVWVLTDAGWKIAHEHSTPANDIVEDPYFEAQAEIRGALLSLDDIPDREGLLAVHVRGPKFSQLDVERGRTGFDEMLDEEAAFVTFLREASIELEIDWRDLKIDVFGDVAVVTSLPRFIMTADDGTVDGFDATATLVWVRAADGWRIAHENINAIQDIVGDLFPEAQEAIRATKEALVEAFRSGDSQTLRSFHLESSKFSKFGSGSDARLDFEGMNAQEAAGLAFVTENLPDVSIDFRELKIDVFGDVAVTTSYPLIHGTAPSGMRIELPLRLTEVWVNTDAGWKIAHEHATQAPDIVRDPFPMDQAAIRAAILSLSDIGRNRDWEALRVAHLEGPKFTDFGAGMERHDFDQMLATEIAALSGMDDFSADFRDLKIDVFGDVAVATSFPIYTGRNANGEKIEIERRATMVYVKTPAGWKIAHEHLSVPEAE